MGDDEATLLPWRRRRLATVSSRGEGSSVDEGQLSTGVPYLRLGQGPPLLVASGLTPEHANPTGMTRRFSLSWAAPFAEHFTVYLCNRRPGLEPGTTVADVAADYATGIEQDIGEPVLLHGTSTGGSVALQLAIDRPDLVRRMVVAAAACRLSARGREIQAEVARAAERGDRRGALASLSAALVPAPLAPLARGIGWLAGGSFTTTPDMLAMIAAEDDFDVEAALPRIDAPTLVIGGAADGFYSEDLFRRTAAGIPHGEAVILRGKDHRYVAGSKGPANLALGFLLA